MTKVILSLAANRYQKSNLARARLCLGEVLSDISYTSEQWTNPMGGTRRELYLNQLATGYTTLAMEELIQRFKAIECDFGRTPQKRQLGIVPIDIDILQYGEKRLHERDWDRPYITSLMQELQ
jgi:2-amino-4-hydroxy-6-hydroxymethyldihydropteridine diphosphokinase